MKQSDESDDARAVFDDVNTSAILGSDQEIVGDGSFAHAFGGPWSQWRGMPTTQPWDGPEPMRGYGYPSYVNPQDVQEDPDFDESFDETILRHTRASRG